MAGTRPANHDSVRCFSLFTVLVLVALAHAQADAAERTFPFEQRAGLMWLKVSVPQSSEPLNFMLDSGAGVSVINLPTAKKLGLKLGQRVDVRGVGSSTEGFWPQRMQATASGVELPKECL